MTSTKTKGTLELIKDGIHHKMHGALLDDRFGRFRVRLDGTEYSSSFYQSDGWTFTPDVPPLPTTPGYYTTRSRLKSNGDLIPGTAVLRLGGGSTSWNEVNLDRRVWSPRDIEAIKDEMLASGDLVRLKLTAITDDK